MTRSMTYSNATKMAIAVATAMLLVVGLVYFLGVRNTFAVAPSDYGLKEGWTISSAGSDDPDIYIVNDWGYKRLFLNPAIFGFYGHLGGFAAVHNVAPATRDAFPTSGLFRNCEANDEKVYGVESTGEDTGMLHWVNTSGSQAVADDPNFFKKVFCINNNEFNWYSKGSNYSSVNQVPNYVRVPGATPGPTGPLSVGLAPDNPAARTITKNAVGVNFLNVWFSGTGTVNTLTVKRLGPGETNDFSNVYIYDGAKRLTSGKSFSSATGETTFINLNVAVNGGKELSVVADMDSTNNTSGNVNYVVLTAVGASGTVSGLPLNGNNVTTSGTTGGSVDTAKQGSLGDPNVGQANVELTEFKVTANTEGASIKRMTLLQGGSVKPSDISNVKLTTGTQTWMGSVTSDGYIVFDLGSGFSIAKGGNTVFKVYGDLAGKKTETVILYFENDSDLLAVGDQYGQGMAEGTNGLDSSAEAFTLTLQGGILTISYNGPNATNIGTDTSDTVFLKYSMSAATNIEVRKSRLTWCWDSAGNGTYDAAADTTNGFNDTLDVKVTDDATGNVVLGPADGSAFTTSRASTCADGVTGASKQFSDVFDLPAGVTKNFTATADVKLSNGTGATANLTSGDKIKLVLEDYSSDTPDVAVMKYSGTNTAIADADIVPNSDIAGSEMTINSASLTLGLAATPGSQTFIKGTKDVDMVGITFAAGQASALRVTDVTLTGYAKDESGDTAAAGVASSPDTAVSVGNALSNVRLYEAESGALIAGSDKVSNNQLSVSGTGTIKFSFSSTPWTIPAGSTKTLLVRADLSTNAASGTNGDLYAFDINTTTEVTALDGASNTVNPSAASVDPNGGTSVTKVMTVKNSGTMTIGQAPSSPVKAAAYWGQNNVPFSSFRLTSTNEGQYVEKLTIIASDSTEATGANANVKNVTLTYKNKSGDTLTSTQSFTSGASANFGWTYSGSGQDTRPYVPKDSSLDIAVAANLRTKTEGASSGVNFSLDMSDTYSGSTANGFRAVGDGSGSVLDGASSGIADVLGKNNQFVYRVYPKLDAVALSAPYSLIGTPDVFKFTVTAMGLSDAKLLFDGGGSAGSGSFKFEVISSGEYIVGGTAQSTSFTVYDENNMTIDTGTITRDALPSPHASLTFDFSSNDVEISGGQSKTFRIQLQNPQTNFKTTTSTGRAADYFQLVLRDDEAGMVNWVDNSTGVSTDPDVQSAIGVLRTLEMSGPTFQR